MRLNWSRQLHTFDRSMRIAMTSPHVSKASCQLFRIINEEFCMLYFNRKLHKNGDTLYCKNEFNCWKRYFVEFPWRWKEDYWPIIAFSFYTKTFAITNLFFYFFLVFLDELTKAFSHVLFIIALGSCETSTEATRLITVVTNNEEHPLIKSHGPSIAWSCELRRQIKYIIFPLTLD